MCEKEKMLNGLIYDPLDDELVNLRQKSHILSKKYNDCFENDESRDMILNELIPNKGENIYIQGPIQFDYGCNTTLGDNCYINFNFTCLDCSWVKIGKNAFIGPNVSLLTPIHPMRFQDRNIFKREEGVYTNKEYAKPITIGDNCWIAGNVTICGGVTIGDGCVIGAGSVVVNNIPNDVFAAGVPCKIIRKITEEDSLENYPDLYNKKLNY